MISKYKFTNGQRVEWRIGTTDPYKTGIIRGLATTELAIVGFTYIVQDTSGFVPNKDYPFSCIPVNEIHLVKMK